MKLFTSVVFLLFFSICIGSAQNYNMSNGNATTCSGNFFDSGGSAGTYGNNQTFVFTICPSTPGGRVQVNFTSFNIENSWDFLTVFDGNSVAAPSLGTYTGTIGPGISQATLGNASGCLTFRFTSDGSVTLAGWTAIISSVVPCQTINANIVSTNPTPQGDGIIRICQGGSVSFSGSGTFSNSGAGASYNWNFGNSQTAVGQNVTTTYPLPGIYRATLVVRDPSNCQSNNAAERIIHVSTTPTFSNSASPNPICLGQSSTITSTPTATPFAINCTPPVAGTTFLPDGSGVSYTTSIPVNCYSPGQTVTSANEIQNVCINMEHSYLGDLQMELICPNGQTAILKSYAQGGLGTYLGCPLDDPAVGPGTARQYCFNSTSLTQLVNGPTSNCGNPSLPSINAGTYAPQQSLASLVGCPFNGNWTIRITDNLAQDNGYIFSWDINFTNNAPGSSTFTPTFSSQGWQSATGLTNVNNTTATVTPTATGNTCYTYNVTDNFGCNYSTTQCVNVTSGLTTNIAGPTTVCAGGSVTLTASGGNTYSWSNGANGASISVSPAVTTVYTVTATAINGCSGTSRITVTPSSYSATATPVNAACATNNGAVNLALGAGTAPFSFLWSNGATSQNI
jgi:subtilisin-like proprotein convertase family protein